MRLPKINVYTCNARHFTVTVDVDEGVTPFMISCKTPGCEEYARSSFYPKGPKPTNIPDPQWEWVIPTKEQIEEIVKKHPESADDIREYYDGTHLHLVPRSNREPIYHGENR